MIAVKDPKGLTINYWNRYFKKFWVVIKNQDSVSDFQQEVEAIAWEIRGKELLDAGKLIGKRWREFLKSSGMRKRKGYWVFRELLYGDAWWAAVAKKWDGRKCCFLVG